MTASVGSTPITRLVNIRQCATRRLRTGGRTVAVSDYPSATTGWRAMSSTSPARPQLDTWSTSSHGEDVSCSTSARTPTEPFLILNAPA